MTPMPYPGRCQVHGGRAGPRQRRAGLNQ